MRHREPSGSGDRRRFLQLAGASVAMSMTANPRVRWLRADEEPPPKPRVAAIVTEYRGYSHADVILGRFLQGHTLKPTETYWPRTQVVSMYVDQFPANDMSRGMAASYGVRMAPTIREALTVGTDQLDVDGVLIIGEHGDYPHNAKGQHMYPRRRFFEEVVKTFESTNSTAPVFNDKHLGYAWEDAKWMYDQSRRMKFPLMAGSSLPTTWRKPELELPLGCEIEESLSIGYGGIEAYGFHALETLQCMNERRQGGETGVRAVTCLEGADVWQAASEARWSRKLLDAVTRCVEKKKPGTPEENCRNPELFLIEYVDGLRSSVVMLDGYSSAFGFAGQLRNNPEPVASHFWLQEPSFGHFAYLTHNIESMFLTGHETYPPERTLLTTGILDAVMTSRAEKHRRVETPWLSEIRYQVTGDCGRRAFFDA
ncbi:MAG: hypothetical protein R3C17_11100 [Planctomycetaceae bacterium]